MFKIKITAVLFCLLILLNNLQSFNAFFLNWNLFGTNNYEDEQQIEAVSGRNREIGECSWYGDLTNSQSHQTRSLEEMNPHDFTAAHKTLPLNSYVTIRNLDNGKSVTVRINDRGPFVDGRILDMTPSAFSQVADLDEMSIPCTVEIF